MDFATYLASQCFTVQYFTLDIDWFALSLSFMSICNTPVPFHGVEHIKSESWFLNPQLLTQLDSNLLWHIK